MPIRQRSPLELERICKAWNDRHPVGKWVRVLRDDGVRLITKTQSPAYVLGGHSAVIMVEGITGCYSLDRLTPIDTVAGVADHA